MWVKPNEVKIFTRPFSKLSVPVFLFGVNYTFRNIPINNNKIVLLLHRRKKTKMNISLIMLI